VSKKQENNHCDYCNNNPAPESISEAHPVYSHLCSPHFWPLTPFYVCSPHKSKSSTEIFQFLPDQLALNVLIYLTRLQKAHRKSGNVSHSLPATTSASTTSTATETTTRTTLEALTPAGLAALTRHALALSIADAAKGGLISAPGAVVGTPTTSALLKLPLLAALPLWQSCAASSVC
jgi:hypothetical protein